MSKLLQYMRDNNSPADNYYENQGQEEEQQESSSGSFFDGAKKWLGEYIDAVSEGRPMWKSEATIKPVDWGTAGGNGSMPTTFSISTYENMQNPETTLGDVGNAIADRISEITPDALKPQVIAPNWQPRPLNDSVYSDTPGTPTADGKFGEIEDENEREKRMNEAAQWAADNMPRSYSAMLGAVSGAANVAGGIRNALGGENSDWILRNAEKSDEAMNKFRQQWENQYGDSGYILNPNGLANDIGNGIGSSVPIMSLSLLAPEAAVGVGTRAITSALTRAGLGRLATSKAGQALIEEVVRSPLSTAGDTMAEYGTVVDDLVQGGMSEDEAREQAKGIIPRNVALDTLTIPGELYVMKGAKGLGRKFQAASTDSIGKRIEKGMARAGLMSAANAIPEGYQEGAQNALEDNVKGERNTSWYNPFSWNDDDLQAARAGAVGGAIMGIPGNVAKGMQTYSNTGNAGIDAAVDAANEYNIDPKALLSIGARESGGDDITAIGSASQNAFQIEDETAENYGVDKMYPDWKTDLKQNAEAAAFILTKKIEENGGDVWAGVAGYNGGGDPDYLAKVQNTYNSIPDDYVSGGGSGIQPYNLPTQGADIDEQVSNLIPEFQSALPTIGGILNEMGLADGAAISSAARTPEHNAEVGGAENSYHVHNDAVDIVLPEGTTQEQADAVAERFRNTGAFKEVLFHDAGSGYHLHLGGYNGGLNGRGGAGGTVESTYKGDGGAAYMEEQREADRQYQQEQRDRDNAYQQEINNIMNDNTSETIANDVDKEMKDAKAQQEESMKALTPEQQKEEISDYLDSVSQDDISDEDFNALWDATQSNDQKQIQTAYQTVQDAKKAQTAKPIKTEDTPVLKSVQKQKQPTQQGTISTENTSANQTEPNTQTVQDNKQTQPLEQTVQPPLNTAPNGNPIHTQQGAMNNETTQSTQSTNNQNVNTKSEQNQRENAETVQAQKGTENQGTTGIIENVRTDNAKQNIPAQYKLVSADDVISSDMPAYPQQYQPRNRNRLGMVAQVEDMSNQLNPSAVVDQTGNVNMGAPVINSKGVVLNGNGRTMAIRKAYSKDNKSAQAYKQYLKDNAEKLGLDPTVVDKIKNPMIVRQVADDAPIEDIIHSTAGGSRMSASEQAKSDAKKIRTSTLDKYKKENSPDLSALSNRAFVKSILDDITTDTDRNAMYTESGQITKEAIRRVQDALFARAYGDDSLLNRMTESTDDNIRIVSKVMLQCAPKVAKLKEGQEHGDFYSEYDVSNVITQAAKDLIEARDAGKPISYKLRENDMFETSKRKDDEAIKITLKFFDDNKRKPRRIQEYVNSLADYVIGMGNPKFETESNPLFDGGDRMTMDELANFTEEEINGGRNSNLYVEGERTNTETKSVPQTVQEESGATGSGSIQKSNETKVKENTASKEANKPKQAQETKATESQEDHKTESEPERTSPDEIDLRTISIEDAERQAMEALGIKPHKKPVLPKPTKGTQKPRKRTPIKDDETIDFHIHIVDDSDEALARALKVFNEEASKLNANPMFNPRLMTAAMEIGAIHLQRGTNKFIDWLKAMSSTDSRLKSYAPAVWKALQVFPKNGTLNEKQMTSLIQFVGVMYHHGITDKIDLRKRFIAALGVKNAKYFDTAYTAIVEYPTAEELKGIDAKEEPAPKEENVVDETLNNENNKDVEPNEDEKKITRDTQKELLKQTLKELKQNHPNDKYTLKDIFNEWINKQKPLTSDLDKDVKRQRNVFMSLMKEIDNEDREKENNNNNEQITTDEENYHGFLDGKTEREQNEIRSALNVKHNPFGFADGFVPIKKTIESDARATRDGRRKPFSEEEYKDRIGRVKKSFKDIMYDYYKYLCSLDSQTTSKESVHKNVESVAKGENNDGQQEKSKGLGGGHTGNEPAKVGRTEKTGESAGTVGKDTGLKRQEEGKNPSTDNRGQTGGMERQSDKKDADRPRSGNDSTGNGTRGNKQPVLTPAQKKNAKPSEVAGHNYHIDLKASDESGSVRGKITQNIAAIKLLKQLEAEGRRATPAEQDVLAKYSGWGTIADAFTDKYGKENAELKEILTEEEYKSAKKASTTAFYTDPKIVNKIWEAVEKLGFKGGRVLDPSMGTGVFFGCMPENIASKSSLTGIEIDNLTGRIAQQLYQKSNIQITGFEKMKGLNNYFDLAISNIPFENIRVHDIEFDKYNYQIHNYFFAKAMSKVRPGGLVAFITGQGTMQSKKDAEVLRVELSKNADLIAAIKLPNTAFKGNAKTDVTTDVLILQKREIPAKKSKYAQSWDKIQSVRVQAGRWMEPTPLNEYYVKNKDNMLGNPIGARTQYRETKFVLDGKGVNLEERFEKLIEKLPNDVYQPRKNKQGDTLKATKTAIADSKMRDGAFIMKDGVPMQNDNGVLKEIKESKANKGRVESYIRLRNIMQELIAAEIDPNSTKEKLDVLRKNLNRFYDEFVKKYGYLNERKNHNSFVSDSSYGTVEALERCEYTKDKGKAAKISKVGKAAIFKERTIEAIKDINHADTASDALTASLNNKGTVDIDYMVQLTGRDKTDIIQELRDSIYKNPVSGNYETSEEYLSGNVLEKLEYAEEAAKTNPAYNENVKALQKVQPVKLQPQEIYASLGASWIPQSDVEDYANSLIDSDDAVKVLYHPALGTWEVQTTGFTEPVSEYQTKRRSFVEILDAALNNKDIKITHTEDKKQVQSKEDIEETTLANQKLEDIRNNFSKWLWEDDERAERLSDYYNRTFNNTALRQYSGSHLNFKGMNAAIKLRDYQKNAIWRIMQDKNTLLAHCVGAGKTFTMQAAAMEMKRLGICQKPLFAVPKNVVNQFAKEFRILYPNANILIIDSDTLPAVPNSTPKKVINKETGEVTTKELTAKEKEKINNQRVKRVRALSRIKTEDWDAIIISHTTLNRLAMAPEAYQAFYQEQIEQLEFAEREITAMENKDVNSKRFLKDLEKKKQNLQAKMEKAMSVEKKDVGITFEDLGIDQIFVDEADKFKNLAFATKLGRISGISSNGSQSAMDMFIKTQYLTKLNNGRGVVFATGTPISNTMNEMYTMMRYLNMDALKNTGNAYFDSWVSTFGQIVTKQERDPSGVGWRNTKAVKFANTPEMVRQFREVADVKRPEDIKIKRPKIKGGKPTVIAVEPTEALKIYIKKDIADRVKAIRSGKGFGQKGADNMLAVTNSLRQASLDMRLINPTLGEEEGGKVRALADQVTQVYKDTEKEKGAQIIFCDLSTPKGTSDKVDEKTTDDDNSKESQDMYARIMKALLQKGIPKNQIAFVHDAKNDEEKQQLFEKVDSGELRLLIGSTEKMGAGTNFQHHLAALHHFTCPWRPRDLEQREGRILRYGNMFDEVQIFEYVTKDSYDANMWEKVKNKAMTIAQAMSGDLTTRIVDDADNGAITYAEAEALATGNPLMREKTEVDTEVMRYKGMLSGHLREVSNAQREIKIHAPEIPNNKAKIERIKKDIAQRQDLSGDKFKAIIDGKTYTERKNADNALLTAVKDLKNNTVEEIGSIGGFAIKARKEVDYSSDKGVHYITKITLVKNFSYEAGPSIKSIESTLNSKPETTLKDTEKETEKLNSSIKAWEKTAGAKFKYQDKLDELLKRQKEINDEFNKIENSTNENTEDTEESTSAKTETPKEQKTGKLTDDEIAALKNKGFNRWTKGNIDRLYIKPTYLGLDLEYYKSGNISSATFNGDSISNSEGRRLNATKCYVDVATRKVVCDNEELKQAAQELLDTTLDTTKYSVRDNSKEIRRFIQEVKDEIKSALPTAKDVTEDGNTLTFTMPNGSKIVVDVQNQIALTAEQLSQAKKDHNIDGNVVVEGYAQKYGKDAYIALSQGSRKGTGYHEVYHVAEDAVLNDKEKSALRKKYPNEEMRADKCAEWVEARKHGKGTLFGKLFRKIQDFAKKMQAILTRTENVHNVFRKIESGEVWNRKAENSEAANAKLAKAARQKLQEDVQIFSNSVDAFMSGKKMPKNIKVMTTPLVMNLIGEKILPIYISPKVMEKILKGKHGEEISSEILKKLPKALTDPLMILKAVNNKGFEDKNKKLVVVDMKDNNGATIMVPFIMDVKANRYELANVIESVYGKGREKPNDQWYIKRLKRGDAVYANKKRIDHWLKTLSLAGAPNGSLVVDSFNLSRIIPDETDLGKLKRENPTKYSIRKTQDKTPLNPKEREQEQRKEDILKAINEIVPVYTKSDVKKNAVTETYYDRRQKVGFVKTPTIREYGRILALNLDQQLKLKNNMELTTNVKQELEKNQSYAALMGDKIKDMTPVQARAEGVSIFGSLYFNGNEEAAAARFPKYYEAFKTALKENKELNDKVNHITEMIGDYKAQNPVLRANSGMQMHDESQKKTTKGKINAILDKVYAEMVDELDPLTKITKLAEKEAQQKLLYKYDVHKQALMAQGNAQSKASLLLNSGKDKEEAINALNDKDMFNGAIQYKVNMNDIMDAIKNVPQEELEKIGVDDARQGLAKYLIAMRTNELSKALDNDYVRPDGFDEEACYNIIKNVPESIKTAAKMVWDFNKNMINIMQQQGLINKKAADTMRKYTYYVPMYHDMSDMQDIDDFIGAVGKGGRGFVDIKPNIYEIKGGNERAIIDPIESMVRMTVTLLNKCQRNKVGQTLARINQDFEGMGSIIAKDPTLKHEDPKKCAFSVYIGGKKVIYRTTPEVYSILTDVDENGASVLESILKPFASALRRGATISPPFIVRNFIRDTVTAGITSQTGFIPFVDSFRGMYKLTTDKQFKMDYLASGASMGTFIRSDVHGAKDLLSEITGDKYSSWPKGLKQIAQFISAVWNHYDKFANLVEDGTRAGEFMRARKKGISLEEAGYLAKEVTLNFGRHGKAGKHINRAAPFFNTTIQGTDKFIRALKKNPARASFMTAVTIILPSVIAWALANGDDDDWYQDLDANTKYTNWCFKIGDAHILIPKPQEAGILFGSGVEAVLNQMMGKDPQAMKQWARQYVEALLPNMFPTMIAPMVEWQTNYSFWKGRALVGKSLQNLPSEYQYNTYTSEIAKALGGTWLAKSLDISPIAIDNAISGYFGSAGRFIANMLNSPVDYLRDSSRPAEPAKYWYEMPFIGSFVRKNHENSEYQNRFYDLVSDMTDDYNRMKHDNPKAKPPKGYKEMETAKKTVSKLNKEIQGIKSDPKMGPEQKLQQIELRQNKIRHFTKKFVTQYGK